LFQVKKWITFNEPWVICVMGYGTGGNAPGLLGIGTLTYQCGHVLLKANAAAYRMYYREFAETQQGESDLESDQSQKTSYYTVQSIKEWLLRTMIF
jgi:beta-glucosidase/6-phospho-beta-glucosidase/beta-galactosidase